MALVLSEIHSATSLSIAATEPRSWQHKARSKAENIWKYGNMLRDKFVTWQETLPGLKVCQFLQQNLVSQPLWEMATLSTSEDWLGSSRSFAAKTWMASPKCSWEIEQIDTTSDLGLWHFHMDFYNKQRTKNVEVPKLTWNLWIFDAPVFFFKTNIHFQLFKTSKPVPFVPIPFHTSTDIDVRRRSDARSKMMVRAQPVGKADKADMSIFMNPKLGN